MLGQIEEWFCFHDRGTNWKKEVKAGTAGFLTMSPILFLNPKVLEVSGLDKEQVAVATALSSGIASILCGVASNLPVALAPGLGLSAYLSYGMVRSQNIPLEHCFTACFISGLLLLLLTVTRATKLIMNKTPESVKVATILGMGLFLTLIALENIGVVVGDHTSLVKLGPVFSIRVLVATIGLVVACIVEHHHIRGGTVLTISVTALMAFATSGNWPSGIVKMPSFASWTWPSKSTWKIAPGVSGFLLIAVFDVSGVVSGMVRLAGLPQTSGAGIGSASWWAFVSTAIGTMLAACLKSSPIIVMIESGAAISAGGRTGLTGVVTGLWFLLSIFLAPILGSVPPEAAAPVLVLIGASMMSLSSEIDWKNIPQGIPAFVCMTLMPLSFSLTNGILAGLFLHVVLWFGCRNWAQNLDEQHSAAEEDEEKHEFLEPMINASNNNLTDNR